MKNIKRENTMKMYETRVEMWRKIKKQHDSLREKIEAFYHLHEDMLPSDEYFTMKNPSEEEIKMLEINCTPDNGQLKVEQTRS